MAVATSVVVALVVACLGIATASARATGSVWDRPELTDPTTVRLSDANRNLKLDPRRDYILECPRPRTVLHYALVVAGGRNVVLERCDFQVRGLNAAAEFKNQTGVLWVHDADFGGSHLRQGIQLQEPRATVVLRDVLLGTVHGSYSRNHAELIQTWAGPRRLLIDGFDGATTYQGFFLLPDQFDHGPPPQIFDFRHVYIDDSRGAYALWRDGSWPLNVEDVYVRPNPARLWRGWWLWPRPSSGNTSWSAVVAGEPPGGPYVTPAYHGATGVDEQTSPAPLADGDP